MDDPELFSSWCLLYMAMGIMFLCVTQYSKTSMKCTAAQASGMEIKFSEQMLRFKYLYQTMISGDVFAYPIIIYSKISVIPGL